MKNYAKIGGRKGKPGYRTPSKFKIKKCKHVNKGKSVSSSRQTRNN